MLKIRSANKVAHALVSELVMLVTDAGAFFHPALQLEIRGAEFNFTARKNINTDERLVTLPLRCMPVLDDFNWSLDSNHNLCWREVESPLSTEYELHKQIVDLLVRLYNHLGKASSFNDNSPLIQFAKSRLVMEKLLAIAQEHSFQSKFDQGLNHLIVHAFWYSRVFVDSRTGRVHILPVMEYFDHSIFAGSFFWDDLTSGEGRALGLAFQPIDGGKGIFARYEVMDNLHSFVKYGFVDEKAFFVQSQPFSLQLSNDVALEVGYQSVSSNQRHISDWISPPGYTNSLMYRARLKFLPDRVFMPYLLVPPTRHMPAFEEALGAQLQEIEQHIGALSGELVNPTVIRKVKLALFLENESAYRTISQAARESNLKNTAPETRLLKKMVNHQRKILEEFKNALG